MCNGKCSNTTRTVRPHAPQATAVTLHTVADAHARAMRYTDARIKMVQHDLNGEHARHYQNEIRTLRVKMIERIAFLVIAALVGLVFDNWVAVPVLIAAGAKIMPDTAREVVEFLKRL
jgi:hypothetical protein